MFTNKHVIVALLVAPVMAVLGWFAVGQLIGERAAPAQAGQSYPLLAQSNCRYASGSCELKNADMWLRLQAEPGDAPRLLLTASHPLDGVKLALAAAAGGEPAEPAAMASPRELKPDSDDGRHWVLTLSRDLPADARLQLVARAAGALYFAETETAFAGPRERELRR